MSAFVKTWTRGVTLSTKYLLPTATNKAPTDTSILDGKFLLFITKDDKDIIKAKNVPRNNFMNSREPLLDTVISKTPVG